MAVSIGNDGIFLRDFRIWTTKETQTFGVKEDSGITVMRPLSSSTGSPTLLGQFPQPGDYKMPSLLTVFSAISAGS